MKLDASLSGQFAIGGDLTVNRLGFGAMRITGPDVWGEPEDHDEAIRVLKRLPEIGVDLIDTADSYGPFVSEQLIADALHPYGGIKIATKGSLVRYPGNSTNPSWPVIGDPAYLRQCVYMSLRRLKLEQIDLWQLHRIDPKVPRAEQFGAIREFIDEGLIRHAGLSQGEGCHGRPDRTGLAVEAQPRDPADSRHQQGRAPGGKSGRRGDHAERRGIRRTRCRRPTRLNPCARPAGCGCRSRSRRALFTLTPRLSPRAWICHQIARRGHGQAVSTLTHRTPIPASSAEADTLPTAALLMLAMTGFIAIVTETLPAGLLPQIAQDLAIPATAAGQMVTVYAAGSLLAAIPLVSLTQTRRRKPVLMLALAGFLFFNLVTAFSPWFALTLVARFLAGVSAGLSWGLLGGYARRMVVDRLKGRALAVAMVGTPLALSIGVPLGTFTGGIIGWRGAFVSLSVVAALLLVAMAWRMPDVPGQPPERRISIGSVLGSAGVRSILFTALAWVTAQYMLYTYIAVFAGTLGRSADVDLLLLAFGVAAIVGIWLAGVMVDRHLRLHVIGSLVLFVAVTLVFTSPASAALFAVPAMMLWGASFGGAATSIQTAASDAAGEGVDIVGAMLTTVWNAGIAAGGALGALVLARGGASVLPASMLPLILVALATALACRRHGFKAGARA
ncbi:MFS transporter [Xylella fastidiosa]|uniref:MFS transporter n=1 Tax=Xylella fastidiosa TaxID=2371 RepID=UPI003D056F96